MTKKVISIFAVIVFVSIVVWVLDGNFSKVAPPAVELSALSETKAVSRATAMPDVKMETSGSMNKVASIDTLVEGLRRRLEQDPNDMNGWVLLAKSYHHLQRWNEAADAFAKAKALGYEADAMPLPPNSSNQEGMNQGVARDRNAEGDNMTAADKLLFDHIGQIQ